MDAVDWLRVALVSHPLVAAAAAAAPLWLWGQRRRAPPAARPRTRIAPAAALTLLAIYAAIAIAYAVTDHFFDPAEPTMPAVGWIAVHGQPVYPALDAAERYAHVYGPLAFLLPGVALRLFGASLLVAKGLGVATALAALGLTFLTLRRTPPAILGRSGLALTATAACAVVFLDFRDYTFWTRPEPFLLLLVAAAVWVVSARLGLVGAVGVGILAGLAVNFKITGALYLLPIVIALAVRDGWSMVPASAASALVVAILPFLLPNVSLSHYVDWLRLSAGNGVVGSTLRQDAEWTIFLLLPLAALDARALRRPTGIALIASMGLVAVAGAKPGGGPYHLLPFVPVIAWLAVEAWRRPADRQTPPLRVPAAVLLLAASVIAVALAILQQVSFHRVMYERASSSEAADLRTFLAAHRGQTVHVGHGRADVLTFVRPLAVFASGVYVLDAPAVQEHQRAGLPLPAATLEAVRSCRIDIWLLPKGSPPFEGANRYAPAEMPALFPAPFVEAFEARYVRVDATRYFDVWRCRT